MPFFSFHIPSLVLFSRTSLLCSTKPGLCDLNSGTWHLRIITFYFIRGKSFFRPWKWHYSKCNTAFFPTALKSINIVYKYIITHNTREALIKMLICSSESPPVLTCPGFCLPGHIHSCLLDGDYYGCMQPERRLQEVHITSCAFQWKIIILYVFIYR